MTFNLPSGKYPRLIALTIGAKRKTFKYLVGKLAERQVRFETWSYDKFFAARRLPQAAYIFTDFDRLNAWQIEVAGRYYHFLSQQGMPVLNDPGHYINRAALLKRLFAEGINTFRVWLPSHGEQPGKFPVFLRTIHAHRGVESGLLSTADQAHQALDAALAKGRVLADLCFVEYAAQPDPDTGYFRKHAAHFIGPNVVRAMSVTQSNWVAKHGEVGLATEEDYARDLEETENFPHAELIRKVAEIAGLQYGRVDFGIVHGRPQIYEVNSNPTLAATKEHPSPLRLQADRLAWDKMLELLARLPPPASRATLPARAALPRRWGKSYSDIQP